MIAPCGARAPRRHRQIKQQRSIGLEIQRSPLFQRADTRHGLAASAALVGVAGIGVAVAEYPPPRRQRRFDEFAHQLGTRGEHQQQLGLGAEPGLRRIEQQHAQRFTQDGATWLTRAHDLDSLRAQPVFETTEQRALASTLATFQRDETSAHHGWRCRMYLATAAFCSCKVSEN
jgi:hypothetical protein